MKLTPAKVVAGALTLALGLSALAFTSGNSDATPAGDPGCCGAGGCFDSAVCGDAEVLCPAGPDCFAPEVCFDRDMLCPADADAAPDDSAAAKCSTESGERSGCTSGS